MGPLIGIMFLMGLGYMMRGAAEHARSDYRAKKAKAVKSAEKAAAPRTLAPSARRAAQRAHFGAWWGREIGRGFPVIRTGAHAGLIAHRAAQVQQEARREEARTEGLEVEASFRPSIREHRERQAKILAEMGERLAGDPPQRDVRKRVREAADAVILQGPWKRPDETTAEVPASSGPSQVPEPGPYAPAPGDSWGLPPGQPRCGTCGGTGKDPEHGDRPGTGGSCRECLGWGSAPGDPDAPEAPAGSVCTACGNPARPGDPVLAEGTGARTHQSHILDDIDRRREALSIAPWPGEDAATWSAADPMPADYMVIDGDRETALTVLKTSQRCPREVGPSTFCGADIFARDNGGYADFCPAHQAEADETEDDFDSPSPSTEGAAPGSHCATIGHFDRPATHEITWTHPSDRDDPVTDPVCAECADSYTRRPALKAAAREITATEGAAPMSADTSYGQVLAASQAFVARADQDAATMQSALNRASADADAMQSAEVDPATLGDQADLIDRLAAAVAAARAVGEQAAVVAGNVRQRHGNLAEAHQSAPVRAAERGFYEE